MTERSRNSIAPLAGLVLAAVLSGCVVAPAPYYGYQVDEPVAVAPPPPREEIIGVAPAPGYLWIGGFWGWSAGRHVWMGGHWEAPRPGYQWTPHRWEHDRDGWRLHHGHWDRR